MVQYTPDTRQHNEKETSDHLSTETVESASRPLEGIDNVESGDGLSLGVLGVSDRITDDLNAEVSKGWRREETNRRTFSKKILRTPRVSS